MPASDVEMTSQRIRAIEDRLAIQNLLAGLALSSDVASEPFWQSSFSEDAVMDRGEHQDRGREQIVAVVGSASQHAAVDYGMSHMSSVPHIQIEDDRAVATGYLLVLVPGAAAAQIELPGKGLSRDIAVYHLTVNRWELLRTGDGWKITRRIIRSMATEDARQLLRVGIEPGGGL
jgi:hypothetical protein